MSWLVLLGIGIMIVLGGFGLWVGEVDRVLDDPELKAEIERARAEEARKKAWRDRLR